MALAGRAVRELEAAARPSIPRSPRWPRSCGTPRCGWRRRARGARRTPTALEHDPGRLDVVEARLGALRDAGDAPRLRRGCAGRRRRGPRAAGTAWRTATGALERLRAEEERAVGARRGLRAQARPSRAQGGRARSRGRSRRTSPISAWPTPGSWSRSTSAPLGARGGDAVRAARGAEPGPCAGAGGRGGVGRRAVAHRARHPRRGARRAGGADARLRRGRRRRRRPHGARGRREAAGPGVVDAGRLRHAPAADRGARRSALPRREGAGRADRGAHRAPRRARGRRRARAHAGRRARRARGRWSWLRALRSGGG